MDDRERENTNDVDEKPEETKKPAEKLALKDWAKDKYVEFSAELKKIVWPSRDDLVKQTVTTIVISIMFGVYIAGVDGVLGFLYSQLASFFG